MKVAITGVGLLCPSGDDPQTCFADLLQGRSAIRREPDCPELGLKGMVSARCAPSIELPDLPPHRLLGVDRVSLMSLWAGRQALHHAQQHSHIKAPLPLDRMHVIWGCGIGGMNTMDQAYRDLVVQQKKRVRPSTVPMIMPNTPAFHLAHFLDLRGPISTHTAACASSAIAIGQGSQLIDSGRATAVLVGGVESHLVPLALRAWQATGALAQAESESPEASCRPFDLARTGFPIGEGAAALVLESAEAAQRRGAPILGYVLGYGHTTDASHIAHPTSAPQAKAMREALQDAGLQASAVAHINAHGTATVVGDATEAASLHTIFGPDLLQQLPISATKALHGHALGGCGAIEAVITLMALNHGMAPPNPHTTRLDPDLPALYIPRTATALGPPQGPHGGRVGLSNAFAFGGVNTALILEGAPTIA